MRDRPLPAPHDPDERVVIAYATDWEVRQFARDDTRFEYFARRGFLHLQLWHPALGISILTPSRLTRGAFDVRDIDDPMIRTPRWDLVACCLGDRAALPHAADVRALERWFILRHEPAELHLLRTWWAGAPPHARP
jgi:hypothetical protein